MDDYIIEYGLPLVWELSDLVYMRWMKSVQEISVIIGKRGLETLLLMNYGGYSKDEGNCKQYSKW